MLSFFGICFLLLATISATATILSPIIRFYRAEKYYTNFVYGTISCQFLFISLAFFTLIYAFAISDFSLALVFNHSHSLKPFIYKITGSWGNHEGSVLLWLWLLSLVNFLFIFLGRINDITKRYILIIESVIALGFLLFIICTSNPFTPIFPVPLDGQGLNPLLQDIGLAFHPPILYLGYVGSSMVFAISIVALLSGNFDKMTAANMHSWAIFTWIFLTAGIGLGSWWAYRELGWGGFWFWDPVENASLMPWLISTALLHSAIVSYKKSALVISSILLAMGTFIFSLLATFLVRSGILISVHSFASDPSRGYFVLGFISFIVIGSCLIFAFKIAKIKQSYDQLLAGREAGIFLQIILLCYAFFTVTWGTLYPIFHQLLTKRQLTVAGAYYNKTLIPITIPFLSLMLIAPHLKWGSNKLPKMRLGFALSCIASIAITLVLSKNYNVDSLLSLLIILASVLVVTLSLVDFAKRISWPIKNLSAFKLTTSFYAMFLSHLGFAILMLAITIVSHGQEEKNINIKIGDNIKIADYNISLKKIDYGNGQNYLYRRAKLYIDKDGNEVNTLYPETRFYPVEEKFTAESAIYSSFASDIYAVIGEYNQNNQTILLKIYYKPLINYIWLSIVFIIIGAIYALIKPINKR